MQKGLPGAGGAAPVGRGGRGGGRGLPQEGAGADAPPEPVVRRPCSQDLTAQSPSPTFFSLLIVVKRI